ncbi:MAG: cell division protein FtsZ [Verrucomicrobiota bacterium]|jgi:cell division protein FtsZ
MMTTLDESSPTLSEIKDAPLAIKVIGVGGAGGNAVSHLAARHFPGIAFATVNTDAMALRQTAAGARLSIGSRTMRGLGAGGDPARGRAAGEEDADAIRALIGDAKIVFIVAGLGGGTGTGASPVVARIAKECGALVLAIVVTPFDCEGGRRMRQAHLGLQELKSAADGVICLPNQRVFKLVDDKTSLLEAFQITNDLIAEGVRGIWRLLSRPGLINVDFAGLCAVTQGRHAESALATAEARGEHRTREVMEKLMAHPLIEGGAALADASGVVVCIAGGPGLSLTDVNRIMDPISRHCEGANVIMGAAIDNELEDAICVTLLAVKSAAALDAPARPTEAAGTVPIATAQAALPADALNGEKNQFRAPSTAPAAFPPPQAGRGRKGMSRPRQGQLALEMISRGRFEKSEPTIHHGQDLDLPTYLRRGVALN